MSDSNSESNNDNKLTKSIQIPVPKKVGITARIAEAKKASIALTETNPTGKKERLILIFDDSGSMSGKPIEDAKEATELFIKSCNPLDTSLGIISMGSVNIPLTTDLIRLVLETKKFEATAGTPLYARMSEAIRQPVTRVVIFSDGSPTDTYSVGTGIIDKYKEQKIPADCIFLGSENATGYSTMRNIAEQTGGIFIHFKDSSSLKTGLKYLTPAYRGLLMSPLMKEKIEKGEV